MTEHRVTRRPKNHRGVRLLQLADGRQVARWRDPATGAQRQESLDRLGLTNAKQRTEWAVAKADEIKAARLAWSLAGTSAAPMSVDEAIEAYRKARPVAVNTAEARKGPLDGLATYCRERGIRRLDAVTAPKLWPWRDQVVGDLTRKESTRNHYLQVVGTFLRWAVQRDLTPLLPGEKVRALCERIDEPVTAIEFLRPAQLRKVLETALAQDAAAPGRQQVAPFVLALLLTGCRFAELADLGWSEIDLEHGEIRLPAARTKTNRARVIGFVETPTLKTLFEALKGGGEQVFRWPYMAWSTACRRLCEGSGVAFTAHTLRRTAGTVLTCAPSIYGGASAFLSAKRLGHSVQLAEALYAGHLRDLPADAKTFEAAAGIEVLARQIVASVGKLAQG